MIIYCTYLTYYRGNKLPPFYIGSSNINRISDGYRGSVMSKEYKNIWKSELKFFPELFKTTILTHHNTRQEALLQERHFHIKLKVVSNPLYINKTYAIVNGNYRDNMIGENHPNYGTHHSKEAKLKNSESNKGRIPWNKGVITGKRTELQNITRSELFKGHIVSEETKVKISIAKGTPILLNGVPYYSKADACRKLHLTKRQVNKLCSPFAFNNIN